MLLTSDIYQLLLDSLRADKRGLSLEVEEFNRLIRLVNQEIFDEYLKTFEEDQDSSDDISFLKVHDYEITLTALASRRLAYGTMPSNYYRVIGKPWSLDGTTRRFVDLVTSLEDGSREEDFLTKATTTYPTAKIGGVDGTGNIQIKVRPQTITAVYLSYLKTVTIPFLDYYVNNTTFVTTFIADTDVAVSLPAGHTYRDGTLGGVGVTVNSITVNMDWGEGDIGLILAKLISKVGSMLPDQGLQQTGTLEEQKIIS